MDADVFAPAMAGPNISGLCAALGDVLGELGQAGDDLLAALDMTPPTWDPARPAWHLDILERAYQVRRNATHSDADRYRQVRMRVISHWSGGGRWSDIVRLVGAWIGTDDPPADRARVYMWPLVCAVLFSAADAPTAANVDDFRRHFINALQDIAGWAILVKPPSGLTFTLDIGPGLDIGELAGSL